MFLEWTNEQLSGLESSGDSWLELLAPFVPSIVFKFYSTVLRAGKNTFFLMKIINGW